MLAYHPAFDANHCAYRFMHILISSECNNLDWDKLRLADFYYLFPHLLKAISPLPKGLSQGRKYFKKINEPYEKVPNPKRLMFDLKDIQNSTIASLIAKQIIDRESFKNGFVTLVKSNIPGQLLENFNENPIINEDWFKVLSREIHNIEISGGKGFKARTGLMEYRYDQ